MTNQKLNELIKSHREKTMHLTQYDFSLYTDTALRTVQKWESGECIPSINSLKKIFSDNIEKLSLAFSLRDELLNAKAQEPSDDFADNSAEESASESPGMKDISSTPAYVLNKYNNMCAGVPYKVYGDNLKIPCGENTDCNTIVFGGPGSGKRFSYIRPNIAANEYSNYVLVVKNGEEIVQDDAFKDYDVKYINFSYPDRKFVYNPFRYFESDNDVYLFADSLMQHTSKEPFERSFGVSIFSLALLLTKYLCSSETGNKNSSEDCNIFFAIDLLKKQIRDENTFKNALDEVKKKNCMKDSQLFLIQNQFKTVFDTNKSVRNELIRWLLVRLSFLDNFKNLLSGDDNICMNDLFEFDKKVLIINVSPYGDKENILVAVMLEQLLFINRNEKPKEHIKYIVDEAQNLPIESLEAFLLNAKHHNYSVDLLYDSIIQFKNNYPASWIKLFYRSNIVCFSPVDRKTVEFVNSRFNGASIFKNKNSADEKGWSSSILTPFFRIPKDKCIVLIKGKKTFAIDRVKAERYMY